ncbi:hypothetical protein FLONG3_5976 [Fusarium longipes]|uniref:C2H2-type domain-containing protein n=1 Tax=Fusarium longipes TaxID=694270 RepID=A0A395SQW6_9HYPO|nr:hypothetical protein FLONG3_5976 [Fusarium longipes]
MVYSDCWMYQLQQPATVDPNEVLIDPGFNYASQSDHVSAFKIADFAAEPGASSSTAQLPNQYHCSECNCFFEKNRDFKYIKQSPQLGTARFSKLMRRHSKHMKRHEKPVKCKADANCTTTKAEQRDMDRHYRSAHKAYAASKGILTEATSCGFAGCASNFTRRDNLLKHRKKFHGLEEHGRD